MDKILIVDDHVENIHLITRTLESSFLKCRLYQATSAGAALDLCSQMLFDLIISDYSMPEKTGIDLIKSVKSDQRTAHIPIIIVTAVMITPGDLEVTLNSGAHDYIRIPYDPLELTSRVNAALTLSRCHINQIRKKDLELTEKALIQVRHNEFDIALAKDLQTLLDLVDGNEPARNFLLERIGSLEQKIKEDGWKSFELSFQNIHAGFITNLLRAHPSLTPGELRLCMLLKLGMTTKDISAMLYLTPESLKVARSRLRSKLSMSEETGFQSYLAAF